MRARTGVGDGRGRRPPALGRPHQLQRGGAALGAGAEELDHLVDGVGGHAPVGGQLAAGDGDDPVARRGHEVAAGQVGAAPITCAWAGVGHERTKAGPEPDDVGRVEPLGGHRRDRLQQVVDVGPGAPRLVEGALVVGVGGADVDPVAAGPGDDEDRPSLLGSGQDGGHPGRQLRPHEGDVDPLGGPDGGRAIAVGRCRCEGQRSQPGHLVDPDAGGVDDDRRLDLDVAAVGPDGGAGHPSRGPPEEPGEGGVVGDGGAVHEGGGAGHRQGQPGVVDVGVVVQVGPGEPVRGAGRARGRGRPRR